MEEAFRRVVEQIFNNWTGLQLAVTHSSASDSKKIALECLDYMVNYCLYAQNVDTDAIQEALDDIMDEEFETICEDGSTREIATVLSKFLQIIGDGNVELYESEFGKLPTTNQWLIKSQSQSVTEQTHKDSGSDEDSESGETPTPMEEDSEWTQVKSRRSKR